MANAESWVFELNSNGNPNRNKKCNQESSRGDNESSSVTAHLFGVGFAQIAASRKCFTSLDLDSARQEPFTASDIAV